jgi:endonuclease/exonuclease/phosphatase family metal-dependent hydrolase
MHGSDVEKMRTRSLPGIWLEIITRVSAAASSLAAGIPWMSIQSNLWFRFDRVFTTATIQIENFELVGTVKIGSKFISDHFGISFNCL